VYPEIILHFASIMKVLNLRYYRFLRFGAGNDSGALVVFELRQNIPRGISEFAYHFPFLLEDAAFERRNDDAENRCRKKYYYDYCGQNAPYEKAFIQSNQPPAIKFKMNALYFYLKKKRRALNEKLRPAVYGR